MKQDLQIRQSLMEFQTLFLHGIDQGEIPDDRDKAPLKHHWTPKDPDYGCYSYAREMFMPKGMVVVGAIHKKAHLTFLMKGTMTVVSEDGGKRTLTGPMTFVSPAGVKRAFHILEDSILVCVHLTATSGEDNLDPIWDEVISPTYAAIGLEEPDLSRMNDFIESNQKNNKRVGS